MIEFKNVYKSYRTPLLQNLNFTIKPGDFVALSGLSGSGKTTILKMIAGLEDVSQGKIVNQFKNIGYIFQDFHLFPHLNVFDNLCIASKSKKENKQDYEIRANELLHKYGISKLKDNYPSELSGGEKQRVAIARCMMQNPDLILVDEATSALDSMNTIYFMNQLVALNSLGKTIIFISHDENIVNEFSKRTIYV